MICPRCHKEGELTSKVKVAREFMSCCLKCATDLEKHRTYMKAWKAKNAEKNRAWSKRWADNNPEKVRERLKDPEVRRGAVDRMRKWREAQPDIKQRRAAEARKYRSNYRAEVRAYRRNHYEKNKERLLKYRADYIKKNPGFNRAAAARHRALVRQRTVAWADLNAIKEFYKACPPGMVVDHIIPLRGENVCGLHVLSNLQYLTFEENSKKSNKLLEAYAA